MRPTRLGLAAAILAVAVGGGVVVPQSPTASGEVVVTRDDPQAPLECRPREAAQLIEQFFEAFNDGDAAAASYFDFAAVDGGGWYSISEGGVRRPRRHFVARDAADLRRHFTSRHRHEDHMRLLEVSVSYEKRRHIAHLGYHVKRRADDLQALGIRTSIADGKGAIDCEVGKIAVWSMAMRGGKTPRGHDQRLCPRPARRTSAAVACAPRQRARRGR